MNKANLKSYAPKARLDFIKAVTERANVLGISAAGALPAEVRGDVAIIDGREWPAKVAGQREELLSRIKRHGFEQTMDEVAYTWFNRFAALRYMEIHDYLDHGWRVLSSRDGGLPEILRHASEVSLPGLNADRAREMQLAGNQDNELYKLLLVAQCNELSRVMPFLFERIDDDTELLLPENLLRTDSIVAKLVESVPEEDWQEIEVIGWLYQFYISEKKDQVIGKVVKSEDIPAATQLFTPNWIVQYLVQNSVGRLWLMANPTSTLASQWPYYIQPAKQTPEVQAQLDALIQTRVREDGETLNPETITVLDPACGSGHILVVAYDVLKAIYLERGYQPRSIPRLILEKNLYGLDIDDRAAQLAAFALLMKARADDRRLFADPPKLNLLSLQSSAQLNYEDLCTHLAPFNIQRPTILGLIEAFEHAKTYGSLIQIPYQLKLQLAPLHQVLTVVANEGDLYAKHAARELLLLVGQAQLLAMQFDALIANPPYIGSKYLNFHLRELAKSDFSRSKSDLYSMAVERFTRYTKSSGMCGFMTPFTWMFLSSFEDFREIIHGQNTLLSLIQPQYHTFFESAAVPICAFLLQGASTKDYKATFIKLTEFRGAELQPLKTLEAISDSGCLWRFEAKPDDFSLIPGKPIAYWIPTQTIRSFTEMKSIGDVAEAKQGLITGDNGRFLRLWHEVSLESIRFDAKDRADASSLRTKWFPFQKGGEYRKWFGNHFFVVNWKDDGEEIRSFVDENGKLRSRPQSMDYYFRPGVSWTSVTISTFNCRYSPEGFIYSEPGPILYSEDEGERVFLCALLNSKAADFLLQLIAPAMHFNQGHVSCIPKPNFDPHTRNRIVAASERLISISKADWDSREVSWNFDRFPLLADKFPEVVSIEDAYSRFIVRQAGLIKVYSDLEGELNDYFIRALNLGDLLDSHVAPKAISLSTCLEYRFDVDLATDEYVTRFRMEIACELVSYIVGCAMGRFSINQPGLIYANAGNLEFDQSRYDNQFQADADGILPLTDEPWFEDDATVRVLNFLRAIWGTQKLQDNAAWLAESLGRKGSETPEESVRRYFADKFYKDHLQTYKKRPIYWLFSSGKQGAFQALVYLHRYNEGTLARMRAEYVVPLIAKMQSRLEMLNQDVAAASSAAARTKLQKQIESLRKKQIELVAYDEKLRHYADMRITLDLDDGVKVNYAKFGDLVAESKAITGGSDD